MTEEHKALIDEARETFGGEAAAELADQMARKYAAHADELRRFKEDRAARRI